MLSNELIKLRYFEPEDIDKLMTIRSSSKSYDFFYEFEPLNKTQQLQWWESSYNKKNEKNFIIISQETNQLVGTISLVNIDNRNKKAELGRLFVFDEYLGKGFSKDAMKLVIDYGFKHLNLHKIYLEVFTANKKAISLYEKMGFKEEGCLKAHIYKNGDYLDILLMSLFRSSQ